MRVATAEALSAPPADSLDGASLFLDFDGTLVDIAEHPGTVTVDPALRALMDRLATKLEGRLALVSGRAVSQIRALFGEPGFVVAGSHGVEFCYPGGREIRAAAPENLADAVAALRVFAETRQGVLIEEKPFGVALHFRQAPEVREAAGELAAEVAEQFRLRLQPGKMVFELRGATGDKGDALRRLMDDPAMGGTRPIMLGDDDTDEPALAAAADLGGFGILVGPPRETAARYRLPDVAAVRHWLTEACEAIA